jgi:hypothetical protein
MFTVMMAATLLMWQPPQIGAGQGVTTSENYTLPLSSYIQYFTQSMPEPDMRIGVAAEGYSFPFIGVIKLGAPLGVYVFNMISGAYFIRMYLSWRIALFCFLFLIDFVMGKLKMRMGTMLEHTPALKQARATMRGISATAREGRSLRHSRSHYG